MCDFAKRKVHSIGLDGGIMKLNVKNCQHAHNYQSLLSGGKGEDEDYSLGLMREFKKGAWRVPKEG